MITKGVWILVVCWISLLLFDLFPKQNESEWVKEKRREFFHWNRRNVDKLQRIRNRYAGSWHSSSIILLFLATKMIWHESDKNNMKKNLSLTVSLLSIDVKIKQTSYRGFIILRKLFWPMARAISPPKKKFVLLILFENIHDTLLIIRWKLSEFTKRFKVCFYFQLFLSLNILHILLLFYYRIMENDENIACHELVVEWKRTKE